jgi:low temperature requirement protein LtrA
MSPTPPSTNTPLHHHARRMSGRDPHEAHRAATPLELLFDLTFALAFGLAASQFAHAIADGNSIPGSLAFGYASFAICWAWVNFSWFASAYDNDDWIFRLATMVQMSGVLVVAMGLPALFRSIGHGVHLDNKLMVIGYVIMRVAMVSQWLRAAKQDPTRRSACLTYAFAISIAQVGWVTQIVEPFSLPATAALSALLLTVEFAGPVIAERKDGGTPWHAHHIAERYSCFAIIALGEGVVGTVAAMSAVVDRQGWSMDAALVCLVGVGLTFGMWWIYYLVPSAEALQADRGRAFVWGFCQLVAITAIVAAGAGLRVAADYLERTANVGLVATVLAVALPVLIYLASMYALYYYLVRRSEPFQVWLMIATVIVIGMAVGAALVKADMAACLALVALAPVVSIVGFEVRGHRHLQG